MEGHPTASVIIIGDEILKGQTQDTNSHFLCKRLYKCGIRICHISVIPDHIDTIAEEINLHSNKYTYVLTSGGIGPTHDDVTYAGVAKAFGENLILNIELNGILKEWCSNVGLDESAVVKMSTVPESVKLHYDPHNKFLIPIVSLKNVFIFPGIPSYLEYSFSYLENYFCSSASVFSCRSLYVNANEFEIVDILNKAVKYFRDTVRFGSYLDVKSKVFQVKLTIETDSHELLEAAEAYLRSSLPCNSVVSQYVPESKEVSRQFLHFITSSTEDIDFHSRLQESIQVLEKCFQENSAENICLSFNGGKDCTALLHLSFCIFSKYSRINDRSMKAVYVRSKEPFEEIEDFIQQSVKRYNLSLTTYDAPIRDALGKLKCNHPEIKIILMGTRNTDPYSSDLQYFQLTDNGWPSFTRVSPLLHWTYHDVWTFLRKLYVPYCSLYDCGYTSLGCKNNTVVNPQLKKVTQDGEELYQPAYLLSDANEERGGRIMSTLMAFPVALPVTLDMCVEVCTFLGSLVEPSSYKNSLALILNATGEVCLTNSGMKIITETFCSHPLAKLIVRAVQDHYEVTGDGSKSYILLLRQMLRIIRTRGESITVIIDDIFHLVHKILPLVFENIRSTQLILHHSFEYHSSKNNLRILELLAQTFFRSKYSSIISRELSSLLSHLISRSVTDWTKLPTLLACMISNFNNLCSKHHASLQESYILEGILITYRMNKYRSKEKSNIKFVVVQDTSSATNDDENISLRLENSTSVCSFLESHDKCYKEFTILLSACDISLVLVSGIVCEEFHALCLQANILLIDRISYEDLQYIIFSTSVVPLDNYTIIPQSENIGHMKYVKAFYFGQESYLHLGIVSAIDGIVPHHLVLCAPVESLCREYISECKNCLKVIKQSIITENILQVKKSNVSVSLENLPDRHLYLHAYGNASDNELLPERHQLNENFESSNDSSRLSEVPNKIFSVACPAGKWEIILKNDLCKLMKYFPKYSNIISILCESLQSIIAKTNCMQNDSWSSRLKKCTSLLEFQCYSEVNVKQLNYLDMESALEPVCNKELLIFNVATLLIQLLRIDSIVSIKKSI